MFTTVVLGPQGERLDLHLSGPGCDGNDWFTVLAERGMRGVTTDDAPAYGPALRASGLDRVRLPILQRLTRERPPEAGLVLLNLWAAVKQGRVRLQPEVQALLWHLVEDWNDLVRSQRDPRRARLHQPPGGLVWPLQAPGPPDAGAEDRGGHPQLRACDGPRQGLNRRTESRWQGGCR